MKAARASFHSLQSKHWFQPLFQNLIQNSKSISNETNVFYHHAPSDFIYIPIHYRKLVSTTFNFVEKTII